MREGLVAGTATVVPAVADGSDGPGADCAAAPAGLVARASRHGGLLTLLAVYLAAAVLVIPTLTPAAINDDWVYTRSVEILIRDGHLKILTFSAANAVFPVLWGSLFSAVFGLSFGVLRVSTLAITLVGALAFYALLREIEIPHGRSALAVGAYLFNPITFAIGYTFMTDPYFLALAVVSAWLYTRGLRRRPVHSLSLVAGSAAAGMAFLTRQQGLLLPVAVLSYLVVARRIRFDRHGLSLASQVTGLPAVIALLLTIWLKYVNGVPEGSRMFLDRLVGAEPAKIALLGGRMTFIMAMYIGLFVLPFAIAAFVRVPRLMRSLPPFGWALFAAVEAVVVAGMCFFASDGRLMPYVPQFFHRYGLGANDLMGGRTQVAPTALFGLLTVACGLAVLVAVVVVVSSRASRSGSSGPGDSTPPAGAGLMWAMLAWMAVGALIPSFSFVDWKAGGFTSPSLDRYLLPLLPFSLCLVLLAVRRLRLPTMVTGAAVAAMVLVSIAGTRDTLVMQKAIWALDREATAAGVPPDRLDGGASWGGYHLAELSQRQGIPTRTPNPPWWNDLWSTATDSTYIVASSDLPGYVRVKQVEYSQWTLRDPVWLFLLRRADAPWPPAAP